MEKLTGADLPLKERGFAKEKPGRATAYDTSIRTRNIRRRAMGSLPRPCFDKGEMTALESLAAENGDTL